jgi:hypothetical protein
MYKFSGSDQILEEVIQADEKLQSEIHKLINSIWDKEDLPFQCKITLLYNIARRAVKLTVVIMMREGYWIKCCPISFPHG